MTPMRRHVTVISKSHRARDIFRRRYWVMCRRGDHQGPFPTLAAATAARTQHTR